MKLQTYFKLSTLFFLHYFIGGSWMITVGAYMLHTLAYNGTEIGMLNSILAAIALGATFLAGVTADKYVSVDKYLTITYILNAFALIAVGSTTSYYPFLIISIFNTILYGPAFSLLNSYAFSNIPEADIKKVFPRIRLWGTIGWIVSGLIVGGFNLDLTNVPFFIGAGVSFFLGIFCFFIPHTPPLRKEASFSLKSMAGIETLKLAYRKDFLVLFISTALIFIPVAWYYFFTNAFLNEINFSNAAAKMTLGQMVELGMLFLMPFILNRFNLKKIIFVGFTIWGLRFFLFTLGIQFNINTFFYAGILIHGFAHTFTSIATQIWLDKNTPHHLRNSIQGLLAVISSGFSQIIGALLAGWVVDYFAIGDGLHNWELIWLIPGVIGLSTAFFFLLTFKSQDTEKM